MLSKSLDMLGVEITLDKLSQCLSVHTYSMTALYQPRACDLYCSVSYAYVGMRPLESCQATAYNGANVSLSFIFFSCIFKPNPERQHPGSWKEGCEIWLLTGEEGIRHVHVGRLLSVGRERGSRELCTWQRSPVWWLSLGYLWLCKAGKYVWRVTRTNYTGEMKLSWDKKRKKKKR